EAVVENADDVGVPESREDPELAGERPADLIAVVGVEAVEAEALDGRDPARQPVHSAMDRPVPAPCELVDELVAAADELADRRPGLRGRVATGGDERARPEAEVLARPHLLAPTFIRLRRSASSTVADSRIAGRRAGHSSLGCAFDVDADASDADASD